MSLEKRKTILVIGAHGYVGQHLCESLDDAYLVHRASHEEKNGYHHLDVTDMTATSKIIQKLQPDIVIHLAAVSSLKQCEEDWNGSYQVNVVGTDHIVQAIRTLKKDCKLIFLSSDYVFDGNRGNYLEDDSLSPSTAYGKMKVEAETIIQKHLKNYLIVRTANVYLKGGNFFGYLKNNLFSETPAEYFNDVYYTPTSIDTLTSGIKGALTGDWQGIIHIAGAERVSRYEFARLFAKVLLLDDKKLAIPSSCPKDLPIGKDLSLNTNKFKRLMKDTALLTIRESLYLGYGLLAEPYFSFGDDRGSITGIMQKKSFEEVNFITSKSGCMRGSHYHQETEEVIHLISGKVRVTLARIDNTVLKSFVLNKGQTVILLSNIVHTFETLLPSSWINMLSQAMVGSHKDIHHVDLLTEKRNQRGEKIRV